MLGKKMFCFYYSDGDFIEASLKYGEKFGLYSNSEWLLMCVGMGIRCERKYHDRAIAYADRFFLPEYQGYAY